MISGPDGYKYKAIPPIEGRKELFVSVGLRVSNLASSTAYWCDLLGMSKFSPPVPVSDAGESGTKGYLSETVGYAEEQVTARLVTRLRACDHSCTPGRNQVLPEAYGGLGYLR